MQSLNKSLSPLQSQVNNFDQLILFVNLLFILKMF